MLELILGGARSGKSAYAETLAQQTGRPVTYIATCVPADVGMQARVDEHRQRRPAEWRTHEVGTQPLEAVLHAVDAPGEVILVDCMTLWLSQQLMGTSRDVAAATHNVFDQLNAMHADVLLVSGEVGLGIVPMGELTRRFVDALGLLNQQLAQHADRVWWVVAGLPQCLKGEATS